MATIRIADDAHPKGGLLLSKSETQSSQTLRRNSNDDGIYNIRSRSRALSHDQRLDEDPELRKEGDFKQKQVQSDQSQACGGRCSHHSGIQRQNAALACIPVDWSHLWRHRNQPPICLLLHFLLPTSIRRPYRCLVHNHLEPLYDGDGKIRPHNPPRRQRGRGRNLQHLLTAEPLCMMDFLPTLLSNPTLTIDLVEHHQ
jgi:hypothetical protein